MYTDCAWVSRSFVAGLLATVLLAGCAATPAAKIPLEDALSSNQVSAMLRSRGTYGDVIIANVTSNTDQAIEVTVTPGTLLKNNNGTGEGFVLYKYKGMLTAANSNRYQENARLILRNRNDNHLAMIEAYSVNALADPAEITDTFTLNGKAGADVQAVIGAATAGDSIEAKQLAVWAVTDDVATSDLNTIQFAYKPEDLTAAEAILRRAKLEPSQYKLFAEK
jgi:hypothetical protein